MKLPQQIRGAIFDLDGTLLDSMDAWGKVDERFFAGRGIRMPDDYRDAIRTLDFSDAALYTKTRFSLPESTQEIVQEWRAMIAEEYALRVEAKPYAPEALRALSASGVRLAVATSSAPELFRPALVRCGIDSLFSAFVTTRDAGRDKNFPDVYLEAARRIGLPPERCAVFEDLLAGIASARTGGFFTVGVYDAYAAAEEAEIARSADLYLRSYADLL